MSSGDACEDALDDFDLSSLAIDDRTEALSHRGGNPPSDVSLQGPMSERGMPAVNRLVINAPNSSLVINIGHSLARSASTTAAGQDSSSVGRAEHATHPVRGSEGRVRRARASNSVSSAHEFPAPRNRAAARGQPSNDEGLGERMFHIEAALEDVNSGSSVRVTSASAPPERVRTPVASVSMFAT